MGLAIVVGFILGLLKLTQFDWIRVPTQWYIDFIRGTPLLVQIFIAYYGLAGIGLNLPAPVAAVTALGFASGAFIAEIVRAGVQAIEKGQLEAAHSLGMTHLQATRRIVLPQALLIILPPLTNEFITLIKGSSLISVIAITELTRAGQIIMAATFAPFEIYLSIAAIYLIITLLLTKLAYTFEGRVSIYR